MWLFAWGGVVKSECKYTTKYSHSKYVDKISSQQVIFVLIFAAQTLKHETMEALTAVSGLPAWMEIVGLFLWCVSLILSTYYGRKYRNIKKKLRASTETNSNLVDEIYRWKDTHNKDVDRWLDAMASNNEFVIKSKSLESFNKTLRTEIAELKDQRRVQAMEFAMETFDATCGIGTEIDHAKVVSDAKAYYRFLIGKA